MTVKMQVRLTLVALTAAVTLHSVPLMAQWRAGVVTTQAQAVPVCREHCLWQQHPEDGRIIGVACIVDVYSPPLSEPHGVTCSVMNFDCQLNGPCEFAMGGSVLRPDGTLLVLGNECTVTLLATSLPTGHATLMPVTEVLVSDGDVTLGARGIGEGRD